MQEYYRRRAGVYDASMGYDVAETAVPYHQYTYPQKTCLIVGHEDHGVTKAVLAECDDAVFIPMYGKGLSLNVHVALSIVTYQVLHQNI